MLLFLLLGARRGAGRIAVSSSSSCLQSFQQLGTALMYVFIVCAHSNSDTDGFCFDV
jgi:hypothetical protein